MSKTTTEQNQTTVITDDITNKTLPVVSQEMVTIDQADQTRQQHIQQLVNEIDPQDSNSVIYFGSKAQQKLTTISDNMLEGVQNKDIGPAADSLNNMVATLRGFDIDDLDPLRERGFFEKLFSRTKPLVKFVQGYEKVRGQIDNITDSLEEHKTKLLTDVASLDRLYEANLEYFHDLEDYILAGEKKLTLLGTVDIPDLAQKAEKSSDMIMAQELRDLRSMRDDLERRVHDLRLTRQVTLQSLPSIRLVQENDKGLIRKIQSTMVNTVPLWRQQLAQAVTIYRSSEAAGSVKAATDLTNDLLEANADNLKTANAAVRKEIERGIVDISSIKKAHQSLIDTIEESLQIADEGKKMRASAVLELQQVEGELKAKLSQAHANPKIEADVPASESADASKKDAATNDNNSAKS